MRTDDAQLVCCIAEPWLACCGRDDISLVTTLQVADFFARLVQRVAPKHYAQAMAEVTVTRLFLENFSGDQVRPTGKLREKTD